MSQEFSRKNLRGRSFKGQDLTGANFSYADIRGANFTNAILRGANFSYAKAGLQHHWAIFLVIVSFLLATVSGLTSAIASAWLYYVLINVPSAIGLILLAVSFISSIRKGLEAAIWTVPVAAIVGVTMAVTGTATLPVAVSVPGAVVLFASGTVLAALAVAVAVLASATYAGVATLIVALVVTLVYAGIKVGAVASLFILLGGYIGWQASVGEPKFALIRKIATAFAATGGTSFRCADLTDANFTQASLKCTKFIGANLTRTLFYKAKKMLFARVGKSILEPVSIRTLLVTGNGQYKSYVGVNLRGANLIGADLRGANLKGSNISEATFQGANLEMANLALTEAIGTDFSSAQMTGACLEAWNIDSSTKLDNIDCLFIYLLEYPKPGTDDRERRPSSGEFAPGKFTKLFQEVLATVDLIFRNDVDWKAFILAFQKVQVENENTELTIQSIENKGDGVVVVRVNVPPDTNKEKIHREFTQNYELALKAIEEKYQAKLESKDEQITVYRQQLEDSRQREIQQNSNMKEIIEILAKPAVNLPVNLSEVKAIAERQTAVNLVVLTLGSGDFEKGFPSVIAQIWTGSARLPIQGSGELPPAPNISVLYEEWQSIYHRLELSYRMKKPKLQGTNFSLKGIDRIARELEESLNKWLNSERFLPIDRILREKLNRYDEVQVIIQSENIDVRRLPWHLWDFLKVYRKAEIALSSPFYDRAFKTAVTRDRIRILSILGSDRGINLDKDQELLTQLDAETSFLVKPKRQELDAQLWEKKGWDILCFSGHSSSEMDSSTGYIYINDTDSLTIPELKNALQTAIERGLQIAIFNSCDSLGLATQLAQLHIPQIIVFRESVPDRVAQEFLKNFLTAFASGKSFYLAVREARERLQSLEHHFPFASWLPVICQNPAEVPPSWYSLQNP
ncbi:pentapeptide repeat-containing protein [Microcoleus sp. herbarium2]|uniref:pentapeptide repeat-containing protein n=1 Tax=Microcoleus sp. herbarium2 TaxID=3055433 RepID=UPI002FD36F63